MLCPWRERLKAVASRKNQFRGAGGCMLECGGHLTQVCWCGSSDPSSDTWQRSRDGSPSLPSHAPAQCWPSGCPGAICPFLSIYLSISHSNTQCPLSNFTPNLGAVIFPSEKRNKIFKIFMSFVFTPTIFSYCFLMCLLHCAPTILCNQMAQEWRTKATEKWVGRKGNRSSKQKVKAESEIGAKLKCLSHW